LIFGGEGGIRTHGTRKRTPDFESGPFDHSGTSPLDLSRLKPLLQGAVDCTQCGTPIPEAATNSLR
jgi:hypothetical protein